MAYTSSWASMPRGPVAPRAPVALMAPYLKGTSTTRCGARVRSSSSALHPTSLSTSWATTRRSGCYRDSEPSLPVGHNHTGHNYINRRSGCCRASGAIAAGGRSILGFYCSSTTPLPPYHRTALCSAPMLTAPSDGPISSMVLCRASQSLPTAPRPTNRPIVTQAATRKCQAAAFQVMMWALITYRVQTDRSVTTATFMCELTLIRNHFSARKTVECCKNSFFPLYK